jgi:uncharacterized protein YjiS (DUF1127 family)
MQLLLFLSQTTSVEKTGERTPKDGRSLCDVTSQACPHEILATVKAHWVTKSRFRVVATCLRQLAKALNTRAIAVSDAVIQCRERALQRRALGSLDDTQLKDIGLTRADISIEVRKPFWRP